MIEIEETGSGLYVTDAAKNELHIEMPDWREGGAEQPIDREVDEIISGFASEIRVPQSAVCIDTDGRQRWRTYGNDTEALEIEHGEHLIQVSSNVYVYIRVIGEFQISRDVSDSKIRITFGSKTGITLGIRSMIRRPNHTIRTPATPEELGEAVTHLSIALDTPSPDRSYPSLRGYPPRLELDDELIIPDPVQESREITGITIEVPDDLWKIFVVSPLAYYLQAEVSVIDRNRPTLKMTDSGIEVEIESDGEFETGVVNLLRRVFWLDCLVRNEGPFGLDLVEEQLLDRIEIDASHLYTANPRERLSAYLQADFESIKSDLPEWHLATYVDPVEQNVPAIPHLLEKLSLIYRPESRPAERKELLEYSLDRFYRSLSRPGSAESVNQAEPRFPNYRHGRVLGWLADGYPVDVFKVTPQAFENKLDYLDGTAEAKQIVVVINDPKMEEEKAVVSNNYNERASDLAIDVSVKRDISSADLARVFEDESDFVHYIGHCTEAGLLCDDGYLSINSLGSSQARTFFLNACGSFQEGKALIEKGSVSGVVTRNRVLNQEATRIGSTFANLIVHGYNLEQSLNFARMKSIANLQYFVIGDGTYTLTQGVNLDPSYTKIESTDRNIYHVSDINNYVQNIGGCQQTYFHDVDSYRLTGNSWDLQMNRSQLINTLKSENCPVIFDGCYYWSDELSIKLRN